MDRNILDGYGHERVYTHAERAEQIRVSSLIAELRPLGVELHRAELSPEQMERILAIVKEEKA